MRVAVARGETVRKTAVTSAPTVESRSRSSQGSSASIMPNKAGTRRMTPSLMPNICVSSAVEGEIRRAAHRRRNPARLPELPYRQRLLRFGRRQGSLPNWLAA
ncbi:MAG: hypothetical protein M5U34_32575 [Chloroflexi bacterium]|nr:hypothetical protein [Chloroflexota bacterium]